MECLVRLASIRRAFFADDATRLKFLTHLMAGTKEILQTGKGRDDFTLFIFHMAIFFLIIYFSDREIVIVKACHKEGEEGGDYLSEKVINSQFNGWTGSCYG